MVWRPIATVCKEEEKGLKGKMFDLLKVTLGNLSIENSGIKGETRAFFLSFK